MLRWLKDGAIVKEKIDLTNIKQCINGHYLTENNIIHHKHYGTIREQCRECKRIHDSQYKFINGVYIRTKHIMKHRSGTGLLGGSNGQSYRINRNAIIDFLGGICIKCGFNDKRALQIDHINGKGVKELKNITSHLQYYNKIRQSVMDGKNEYQLLCANCNWIKRSENNENPNL